MAAKRRNTSGRRGKTDPAFRNAGFVQKEQRRLPASSPHRGPRRSRPLASHGTGRSEGGDLPRRPRDDRYLEQTPQWFFSQRKPPTACRSHGCREGARKNGGAQDRALATTTAGTVGAASGVRRRGRHGARGPALVAMETLHSAQSRSFTTTEAPPLFPIKETRPRRAAEKSAHRAQTLARGSTHPVMHP